MRIGLTVTGWAQALSFVRTPFFQIFASTPHQRRLADFCGDFRISFKVRGKKLQGTLHMTGEVPIAYAVKGEILDDGSLKNLRFEKLSTETYGSTKPEFLGTLAKGRWEWDANGAKVGLAVELMWHRVVRLERSGVPQIR